MPVCVSLLVDLTVSSAWAGQKNRGYIMVQESCCQTMESRAKQKIRYETAESRADQKIRYETAESRADQKMQHQIAESRTEQKNPEGSPSLQILAPGAVLMEASTGQIIYEKNADERRSPASITKIMTLILIFDAIDAGKIRLGDEVVTSAHAKSMGGSQVFLEEGEIQTVETLIKCIVIASGNDASVAMAEYISGSEAAFVQSMNERAKGLGMTGTHFVDCCGLTESPEHLTTARDIAVMSRELITKYPQIHNYSTIWMENITHVTKQGSREFGLSNTNRLLKMATNYRVTGLKPVHHPWQNTVCLLPREGWCASDRSDHGSTSYKARFADAPDIVKLRICKIAGSMRTGKCPLLRLWK